MKKNTPKYITQAALIAAVYSTVSLIPGISAISFGPVQLRIAEALTVLPALFPAAIPGLFVGCLITNTIGVTMGLGAGVLDIVFGSLATLLAAWLSYLLRKRAFLVPLPPVVINAVVVGLLLHYVNGFPLVETMLYVAAGQAAACYILGSLLLYFFKKRKDLVTETDKDNKQ